MSQEPGNQKPVQRKEHRIAIGLALGLAIGTAIGVAMDNIALGIAIGVAIGVGVGASLSGESKTHFDPKQRRLILLALFGLGLIFFGAVALFALVGITR